MTVEVGILNGNGVVLAADSAFTLTVNDKKKIFMTDKLFSLSKHHSVGIMVYGNAYFTDIPWEVVIKVYRSYIGSNSFDTLQEYSDNFLQFLSNNKMLYSSIYEDKLVESVLKHCLSDNGIRVKSLQNKDLEYKIENKIKSFSTVKYLDGFDDSFIELFLKRHKNNLLKYMNDYNISIDNKTQENICLMCAYIISKSNFLFENKKESGIVIAGYGSNEIFPALDEYTIVGIIGEKLIYKLKDRVKILEDVLHYISGTIRPFAQKDVILTYLHGIGTKIKDEMTKEIISIFSNFSDVILSEADGVLKDEANAVLKSEAKDGFTLSSVERKIINKVGEKLIKRIVDKFISTQKDNYSGPFIEMLAFLGKEEMANLAEALVNLTSYRYRFTSAEEIVGGQTDVAIITKKEGFKWIKRKEFAKQKINNQFV